MRVIFISMRRMVLLKWEFSEVALMNDYYVDLYLINDQWEDGALYFYSLHNTIAEYKEVEENLYSPVAFGLTTIVIFSLLVCFFCYIY